MLARIGCDDNARAALTAVGVGLSRTDRGHVAHGSGAVGDRKKERRPVDEPSMTTVGCPQRKCRSVRAAERVAPPLGRELDAVPLTQPNWRSCRYFACTHR